MSKPILYHMNYSPPSRFALITAHQIGLDIQVKDVDFFTGEHMSLAYKSINPVSTVPALVDGDIKVFESSAIAIYLVEKYAKDDKLYPKDFILRTMVNEKLFYVSSYIFPRVYQIFVPGYRGIETEIPQRKLEEILRGYESIEGFLKVNDFLAGDFMSLADLSLWTNMETLIQLIPIDIEKFPKFISWIERMRKLSTYPINKKGASEHVAFYRDCVEKAKKKLEKK